MRDSDLPMTAFEAWVIGFFCGLFAAGLVVLATALGAS